MVVDGPVQASGYDWYRVAPVSLTLSGGAADGWVAAADHDGTPWITRAGDPLAGLEFARATVARVDGKPADARRAATSINAFALDLYRRLRADPDFAGKGMVFSPASIVLALAMARAGARGTTASEMDDLLHTDGWKALASGLNALDEELTGHNATWTDDDRNTHALSLRIANTAFGQRGFAIEQDYLDAIAGAFGSQLGLVDYIADPEAAREVINAWVSRQTAKRIPALLAPPDVSNMTRLVLVNAIYLKAKWQLEFDEELTKDRAFTLGDGATLRVPTMSLMGGQEVPYASGAGWKATELRYLGADGSTPLAMALILPDDIDAFETGMTTSKLNSIVAKLGTERTRIARTQDRQVDDDMACRVLRVRGAPVPAALRDRHPCRAGRDARRDGHAPGRRPGSEPTSPASRRPPACSSARSSTRPTSTWTRRAPRPPPRRRSAGTPPAAAVRPRRTGS